MAVGLLYCTDYPILYVVWNSKNSAGDHESTEGNPTLSDTTHSIQFTTGVPGSGKSYLRGVFFLVEEFFFMPVKRTFVTNLPINKQKLAEYCEAEGIATITEVNDRVELIPPEIIHSWKQGGALCHGKGGIPDDVKGPWDYFRGRTNLYISLDECHFLIHKKAGKAWESGWQNWVSVIRHNNNILEMMTQAGRQMNGTIRDLAGLKNELVKTCDERDPFCGITRKEWRNLIASITGYYKPTVRLYESTNKNDSWERRDMGAFRFRPELFPLYNSYSGEADGDGMQVAPKEPYELQTRKRLWLNFFLNNSDRLIPRFLVGCGLFWLMFLGGAGHMARLWAGPKSKKSAKEEKVKGEDKRKERGKSVNDANSRPALGGVKTGNEVSGSLNLTIPGLVSVTGMGKEFVVIDERFYKVGDFIKDKTGIYGDTLTGIKYDEKKLHFAGGDHGTNNVRLPKIPKNPFKRLR